MSKNKWDFAGWATKNNLRCADGLTIRKGAFSANDGETVPLIYNHQHKGIDNILGHAVLQERDEGVYAYCYLNDTPQGRQAKKILQHGDVCSLSIWADTLEKNGRDVLHGIIREVSLVLAGANPGAFIESVVAHGMTMDEDEDEGILYTGEGIYLSHAIDHNEDDDDYEEDEDDDDYEEDEEEEDMARTVEEVFDSMTDEQKEAAILLMQAAAEEALDGVDEDDDDYEEDEDDDDYEEDDEMSHNIFEGAGMNGRDYLSHSDELDILDRAKQLGSLRSAISEAVGDSGVLIHAAIPTDGMTLAEKTQDYGFNNPEFLFPQAKALNGEKPEWLSRDMGWVSKVLGQVHHTPFSRIKSVYANITEDEARAKGYVKGDLKVAEVFDLLKRETTPQLIYKTQKLDRQDILQITSFDIVAWIRAEMKVMLNEEIARAILIGDGRENSSQFKIKEENIRPIATEAPLYNTVVKVPIPDSMEPSKAAELLIDCIVRARGDDYKGSGEPTFWTTGHAVTEMLLLKDQIGHRIYKTMPELSTAIRAKEIVTVEPMEGHQIEIKEGDTLKKYPLLGIMCNLTDYNVGKDPGMEETNFQDFDIDYNKYTYLIETMMSGALIKPFSAVTFVLDKTGTGTGSKWLDTQKGGAATTASTRSNAAKVGHDQL